MMTLGNRLIRHERNMDVCYLVLQSMTTTKKYLVKVQVINMGYVHSYPLGIKLKFEIPFDEAYKWHYCLETDPKLHFFHESDDCLRYKEWSRFK